MRDCQTETKYKVKEAAIKASEIMTEVGLKSGMNSLGKFFRNIVVKFNKEGFLMFFVKNFKIYQKIESKPLRNNPNYFILFF